MKITTEKLDALKPLLRLGMKPPELVSQMLQLGLVESDILISIKYLYDLSFASAKDILVSCCSKYTNADEQQHSELRPALEQLIRDSKNMK